MYGEAAQSSCTVLELSDLAGDPWSDDKQEEKEILVELEREVRYAYAKGYCLIVAYTDNHADSRAVRKVFTKFGFNRTPAIHGGRKRHQDTEVTMWWLYVSPVRGNGRWSNRESVHEMQ